MTDMAAADSGNDSDVSPDAERDDIELEEGLRAAAAAGYDTELTLDGDTIRCAECGHTSPVRDAVFAGAIFVRDTPTGRDGLAVHELTCPSCGRPARLVAPATLTADLADDAEADADSVSDDGQDAFDGSYGTDAHHPTDRTASNPLGDDRQFFDDAEPGNLRDQKDLIDAEGDDIRMYTGEPVETEEGWVLPRQQNVGPGNMAGHGEFPDPNTPPTQEAPVD